MKTFREQFLELALKYADAKVYVFEKENIDKALSKKKLTEANKAVNKIKELYLIEKELGDLNQIGDFMHHENKYVRQLAATYSLVVNAELAEKTLKELMNLPVPNVVIADARMSLEIWKKGFL